MDTDTGWPRHSPCGRPDDRCCPKAPDRLPPPTPRRRRSYTSWVHQEVHRADGANGSSPVYPPRPSKALAASLTRAFVLYPPGTRTQNLRIKSPFLPVHLVTSSAADVRVLRRSVQPVALGSGRVAEFVARDARQNVVASRPVGWRVPAAVGQGRRPALARAPTGCTGTVAWARSSRGTGAKFGKHPSQSGTARVVAGMGTPPSGTLHGSGFPGFAARRPGFANAGPGRTRVGPGIGVRVPHGPSRWRIAFPT
jgi:hypothetical protein